MSVRIFLSHSSKDAVLTQQVADALRAPEGAHPGYEVLVDTECLKAGEEWPIQLHAMMAYAHAGLLLLTRNAINRPDWVRNEAYILAWRRSLDPGFKLFYVLLDDVKSADLPAAGFDPTHLKYVERLNEREPADIAARVKALGPRAAGAPTTFEELVLKLRQALKGVDLQVLELLADRLGAPPVPWCAADPHALVERIAARILAGDLGWYKNLSGLMNELKSLSLGREALDNVLRWVAPYWLHPGAGGQFADLVRALWEEGRGGNALVSGQQVIPYTTQMYVHRARPFDFQCRVAQIEMPSHQADAAYFRHQICEWLRAKEEDDYGDLEEDAIVALLADEEPFLFVPLRPVDKETLNQLRKWFPKVVFVLWTDAKVIPGGFGEALVPPVDEAREGVEYLHWRNARKALRN